MIESLRYKLRVILIACLMGMHVSWVAADVSSFFIRNFSNQEYKASCQNWGMTVGADGLLYVANNSGLLVFDGNSWMTYETPEQAVVEAVAIHRDTVFSGHRNDFGYWVQEETGIYTYHSLLSLLPSVKLRNEIFNSLVSYRNELWIKSDGCCFLYRNGQLSYFPLPPGNTSSGWMQEGEHLYLWVEKKGVYEVRDDNFVPLPVFDPLKDKKVVFIKQLNESSYVVGTENDGVFSVTPSSCQPWTTPVNEELKRAAISSLQVVDGKYLIGTHYGGLYITYPDGRLYEHYDVTRQLPDNNIHGSFKQDEQNVWLAFDNGISLLTFSSPVTLLEERGKIGKLLEGVEKDGAILLRTNQGIFKQVFYPDGHFGVEAYAGVSPFAQETKVHDILASLAPEVADTLLPCRDTLMENDQVLWCVQGNNKIFRLRLSNLAEEVASIKDYTIAFSFRNEAISDLVLIDGFVVVFTGRTCWRYDRVSDSFVRYSLLEEQLGEYASSEMVFPVGDDLYWVAAANEMALFYIKEENAQLKCRILFDNYNLNVVNRDKRIIPLSDSLHLVSAMQGVLLVNTRELIESHLSTKATFHIRQIQYTDDEGTHYIPVTSDKIRLPYDFRNLKIKVGTSVFTPSHHISYKMKGNSTWSEWQNEGDISFFQLPSGKYDLEIRKYVVKGTFPSLLLRIEVGTPWYDTVWAYIIYLLLLWGVVQGGLHYYLKYQRRQEQALLEAERLAEQQRLQQMKNEMLEAELQNKNNELTLQTTALAKRNQVMQSLLKELDDQKEKLGERYPNKFYNRMKTLIEDNINNQSDWVLFESYFNSAHQNFMDRLRDTYPDLTPGDFRICCLLRMNLSTKEIASLLNISVRSVELRRYRLRKRLALDGEANLVDFLSSF